MVEGLQEIDMDALQKSARYENGYSPGHPVIKAFWDVVRHYSTLGKRRLLEFVTASERVPVGGTGHLVFVIQRNGSDSDVSATRHQCGSLIVADLLP